MRSDFQFNPTTVNGVGSWYNPLTWEMVTGYDAAEQQRKSAELDALLAEVNQQALTTGTVDEATYNETVLHIAAQVAETERIDESMDAAVVEGLIEGYKNELAVLEGIPKYAGRLTGDVLGAVTSGVGRGAGSILGGIFGNIPWWVWAGGAVALFLYLGGGRYVERHARSAFTK